MDRKPRARLSDTVCTARRTPGRVLRALPCLMLLAFLTGSWGCGHDPAAPGDAASERHVNGLLVSSPFRVTRGMAALHEAGDAEGSVAYVSIMPGTVPGGATMGVRNPHGGATVTAPMVDGGVDPVAITAAAGDELSITITDGAGHASTSTEAVKQRRPPRVVRTQPTGGSIDVPLNVRVTVVFSGPIDPTTVNAGAITLLQDGSAVAGQTSLSADGLSLSWTPGAPLAVATTYVVVLSQSLEDLNGLPVDGFEPVDFMTGAARDSDNGSLEIIIRTSGAPIDVATDPELQSGEWQLRVGMLPTPYHIRPADMVTIKRLPQGSYDLSWSISPNCRPQGQGVERATVTAGKASHVTAIITCTPWTARLEATIHSSGESVPQEHELVVRSMGYVPVLTATVPANGTAIIPLPDVGQQYQVALTSSNDQCRMLPSSQEVTPGSDGTAAMLFAITCGMPLAMNASIEIITRTTGEPAVSDFWVGQEAMMVSLSHPGGGSVYFVQANDTLVLHDYAVLDHLVSGEHVASWQGMAPNCVGRDPLPFEVVDGQMAHVTLTATCADWTGRLQINLTVSGTLSYWMPTFSISGGGLTGYPPTLIGPNGSGTVPLPTGDYDVSIDLVHTGCSAHANPQRVKVTDVGAVVNFVLACPQY
ncbi:MAG: hypothetical protein H6Q77_2531 [Gemmatimonadetes bacterium]|nr:hypothetical protein [Gemmatimonadota bacterium]